MIPNLSLSDGVVEIVGDNGAHYMAYVVNIYDTKDPCVGSVPSDDSLEEPLITLRFENNWRPKETFPLTRIRLLPKTSTHMLVNGVNTQNEAKHQILAEGKEAEVWTAKKEGHACGFWKCVIKTVKDEFYGVSYGSDDKNNCKIDGKECNEIVTKERIRPMNPNPYMKTNPFFKFMIEVPKELVVMNIDLVKRSETHKHLKKSLSLIAVNYDKPTNRLICIGFADKHKTEAYRMAIKGAELLADVHFRAVKQMIDLRTQIDSFVEQFKNLDEIIKIKENEFEILVRVEEELMRYAIGYNGSNIKKVLQMPGILSVDRVNGIDENVFKVTATNRSSLRMAKEMLQISEREMHIPRDVVPHIIGKGGGLVQEMTDRSGLISIRVKGDDPKEKFKPFVIFQLIGTREAIENAIILLTFQMNCVKENLEFDKLSPKRFDKRRPQLVNSN